MKLHTIGLNYQHPSDFTINRPNGSGDNLFLMFKSSAEVVIDGTEYFAEKNSCILYSKNTKQQYGANGVRFSNHWLHFDMDESDIFLQRCSVPINTLIKPKSSAEIEEILSRIVFESVAHNRNKEDSIDLLIRLLLCKLDGEGDEKTKYTAYSSKLKKMRAELYSNPAESYRVEQLADELSVSTSHFYSLYKQEFGVSCYHDIVNARIEAAKSFLINTDLTVKAISELLGYENDVHFMRQFKLKTGISAGEYRRK